MSMNTALLPYPLSSALTTPSPITTQHHQQHRQTRPPQRPNTHSSASGAPAELPSDRAAGAAAAPASLSASAPAQHAHALPQHPFSRRSTLASRFPLLRKSTASHADTYVHVRASSTSHVLPASLLQPAAPRASISSSRGRFDPPTSTLTPELHPRDSSTSASLRSTRDPDAASDRSGPSLFAASTPSYAPDSDPAGKLDNLQRSTKPARAGDKKMHQTSSRLLRMTDDERPYTRDFKDLFSTLMVSLPLTPHRVRFRMVDFTFTSDEAITNLGSLKFSQSNRMPDPKDASRVVTTTTTTTFSMAKEMARSVCTRFYEAKFIESVEGKFDFNNKSSVWQLSPKGIHILEGFCTRNGIQSTHVKAVIESSRNPHQLVILERGTDTDALHHDEQTIEIIFRRFVGNSANEISSDSDSIHEFGKCDVGVRTIKHKPTQSRPYEHTFNGRNAAEWLMDCSTMVDRREAIEICSMFLQLGLIAPVDARNSSEKFQPAKQVHYYITQHGERVAGWNISEDTPALMDSNAAKARDGAARDSNSNRTNVIIRNPSWRLLYREFLKETMCEENLSFYIEVQDFNNQYRAAVNATGDNKIETIRETLAAAYGLYNAFLAPGSPNELNIDHALRTQLATRMTRAVGDDAAMMQSLVEVASLFEKAQNSIFKLMSSDSVPKFIKHPKYAPQLRGLDAAAAAAYAASPGTSARA